MDDTVVVPAAPTVPSKPVLIVPAAAVIPATPAQEAEKSLRAAGQRHINSIWEYTQAAIAGSVIFTAMAVSTYLIATAKENQVIMAVFSFLGNVTTLVIGFYFGRTNHARTGGVGGADVTSDR